MFRRREFEGQMHRLFESCRSELSSWQFDDLVENVNRHGEYRLALELLADALYEKDFKLSRNQREQMRSIVRVLGDSEMPLRASISLLVWGFERPRVKDSALRGLKDGWLHRLFGIGQSKTEQVANLWRKRVGRCPVCTDSLDFHCMSTIAAVAVAQDQLAEVRVDSMVERREWREISTGRPNEVAGTNDLIIWELLSCPTGAGSILKSLSPFEMWDDDSLLAIARLSAEDFAKCAGMVERWLDL